MQFHDEIVKGSKISSLYMKYGLFIILKRPTNTFGNLVSCIGKYLPWDLLYRVKIS